MASLSCVFRFVAEVVRRICMVGAGMALWIHVEK